jgi:hypothetical protein
MWGIDEEEIGERETDERDRNKDSDKMRMRKMNHKRAADLELPKLA